MAVIPINSVYAVEIAGACNLDTFCTWCPMTNRPRNRARGLMNDDVFKRSLHWVNKLQKIDALALHAFGEPLLHPKLEEYALEFSKLMPITMSTNGILIDEERADKLAKVPWAWITISEWNKFKAQNAAKLLHYRGIKVKIPNGVQHNFASQAQDGPKFESEPIRDCPFLKLGRAVIRWDGDIASCCISDSHHGMIGNVMQEPEELSLTTYDICTNCHELGRL